MNLTDLFSNLGQATDVFTIGDIVFTIILSFLLSLVVAWTYKVTYKGVAYTQSFVHTLILMGMVVAIIMLVIGSNIARAFTLVGALSIVRFRNAIKDTRDVGFIFYTMGMGMGRSLDSRDILESTEVARHVRRWTRRPELRDTRTFAGVVADDAGTICPGVVAGLVAQARPVTDRAGPRPRR